MSGICCPFCPFAGCIWCEHKSGTEGAESPVTQANLVEFEGSKTALGVAPTNTEGLAQPKP